MKIGKSLALSALIIVGLLTGARAQSQTGPGHPRGFHGTRLFENLQLTNEQKATIDGLFAANRENALSLRQRVQEQRQLLRNAAQTQPFDEAAVRFQAQELAKLQSEMMVQRAAVMNQISGILTTEQKAKLQDLREQRKARFQEWRERHRPQPGQQQG
ncbi:MAG: Spy/CpxP family protein refolding chaperone [Deltaproteobacteria bacterium]|nr:Spy/CpxP family protein refolding chaperone [Deltaproteobacteria bacterium]